MKLAFVILVILACMFGPFAWILLGVTFFIWLFKN